MSVASEPLVQRLRRRVRRQGRALADIVVAVLVSASAAMAGLVLDNALPVGATPVTFPGRRWTVMIVLLIVLALSVGYRRRIYQRTGTLYSLSFLDETMRDYHEKAQEDAAHSHLAVRLLGRRVDVLGRERDGVVDVIAPRQELSRALESAINQDRDDTGYAIAPNLLWPAALAVGASLTRTDRMRFLEYDQNTTTEFRLRDKAPERVALRSNHVVSQPTGDRRGVLLSFTSSATKFDRDGRCQEFGVSDLVELSLDNPGRQLTTLELGRLADELAGDLADIKHNTRDRELVVVAFLPKTVALLTGWYLTRYVSRHKVRFFTGTHLMHYLPPPDDRFVAMRVHPSQPTAFPTPRPGGN